MCLIAMYFDGPLQTMRNNQKAESEAIQLTQPVYLPMMVFFAPLLMHSDPKYIKEFWSTNPRDPISRVFFEPIFGNNNNKDDDNNHVSNAAKNKNLLRNVLHYASPTMVSPVVEDMVDGFVKTFIDASNAPSYTGKSHVYKDPNAEPFRDISRDTQRVASFMYSRHPIDALEKAKMMSWLIDMASPPDVPARLTTHSTLNEFELRSIEYSIERFLSTGIFLSNLSLLKNLTKLSYDYQHSAKQSEHITQFLERLVSLFCGYEYPYSADERPEDESYKNPVRVIEFVHHNFAKLKQLVVYAKARQEANSAQQPAPVPPDVEIAGEQKDLMLSSFLQQLLVEIGRRPDEIKTIVQRWYELTQAKQNLLAPKELNYDLAKFLGRLRYDDTTALHLLQAEAQSIKGELLGWIECQELIARYERVLKNQRDAVVAGMLELIDHEKNSNNADPDIKTNVPAFFVSTDFMEVKAQILGSSSSNDIADIRDEDDIDLLIRLNKL